MGVAGCTAGARTVEADTRITLTVVRAVLTLAATVVAAAIGGTTFAIAMGGAQREECSMGGVEAADAVTNGANHPHPSHVSAPVPAAAVGILGEEAARGSPAETLVASAEGAIAGAAEVKAARVQRITAPASTAAKGVFGSSAVIPDRTAPGVTFEMTAARRKSVLLLAASGLLATAVTATALAPAETATALARQTKGADTETLHTARELENAGTTTTVATLTWTVGGGRRVATSEMTAGGGASITAGAMTSRNVARSWAGGAADATATLLMAGYHPTTLEPSHETAKGGVLASLMMVAVLLISTRVSESTSSGMETARRRGTTMMTCWGRS